VKVDFKFLDDYAFFIELNANDTFGYACADGQMIDIQELPGLIELDKLFGPEGIIAFMSVKRNEDPISRLVNKKFKEAKKYIDNNFITDNYKEIVIPKKYLYDSAYEAKGYVILDRKKLEE